ncbi:MAG: protein YgfX [Gammaproteobacteria bacterium]|nr:protein YgfX [Gammaproteobacteria bacterium]
MNRTFYLALQPSAALATLSSLLHLLAAACIAVAALPATVRVALLVAVLCAFCRERASPRAPRGKRSIIAIGASARDGWLLARRDGSVARARRRGDAYVHPLLVVATFVTDDGETERVVVVPDMAPADGLRALRVWLRAAPEETTR